MSVDVDSLLVLVRRRLSEAPSETTAEYRRVRRRLSRELSRAPARLVLDAALGLVASGSPAERFVALELVEHHPEALLSLDAAGVEEMAGTLDSWGAVDTFACCLAGHAWREGRIDDSLILDWAHSSDRWWRRAALVSTVPLNLRARGGRGDAARTVAVARELLDDRDDMVVKAMSWALRELAVREPGAVRLFMSQHWERLAPRVRREVTSKLETGLKRRKAG